MTEKVNYTLGKGNHKTEKSELHELRKSFYNVKKLLK